jgi:hypothetical protein
LGNVGAKIANPVSDMWSIQFNVQGPTFNDGDVLQFEQLLAKYRLRATLPDDPG